jgi:hypothetical protein
MLSLTTILLVAILSGFCGKMYDDLHDNYKLKKYKNETLMETIKGLHFIGVASICLNDTFGFIVFYFINILNSLGNREAFIDPYEKSLFYSYFLLFLLVDYKDIKKPTFFDYLVISTCSLTMFFEPIFISCEFSHKKFFSRLILFTLNISFILLGIFKIIPASNFTNFLCGYGGGYFLFSTIVQYYSLSHANENENENQEEKSLIKKEKKFKKGKKAKKVKI